MAEAITVDFVICSPFPHHRGGREVWLSHVARELAARDGFRIRIWSLLSQHAASNLDYGADEGVELYRLPSLSSLRTLYRGSKLVLGGRRAPLDWYLFCRAAARHVPLAPVNGGAHVVVTVGSIAEGLAGYWLRRRSPDPPAYICSVRGRAEMDTAPYYGLLGRVVLGWEHAAFRAADLIVANGKETVKYVGSRGFEALLQPNGVDYQLFASGAVDLDQEDADQVMGDPNLRYILSTCTVGDTREIRGVAWRLRSVPILRDLYGDGFRLVFIGAGDGSQYRHLVQHLGTEAQVRFCGMRSNVAAFLRRADVVTCLVTQGGGTSHSLLEAMAAGRPIVATDSDTYRQLLEDDNTALLVPPNDDKALAGALAELLSNPQRGLEMGSRAQEVARQYDWPLVAAKLVEHVQLALERRRETPGESREAGEV